MRKKNKEDMTLENDLNERSYPRRYTAVILDGDGIIGDDKMAPMRERLDIRVAFIKSDHVSHIAITLQRKAPYNAEHTAVIRLPYPAVNHPTLTDIRPETYNARAKVISYQGDQTYELVIPITDTDAISSEGIYSASSTFERVAELLKTGSHMHMYIRGTVHTRETFDELKEVWNAQDHRNALSPWLSQDGKFIIEKGQLTHNFKYQYDPKYSFFSWLEYFIILVYGMHYECSIENGSLSSYEEEPQKARVVEIPSCGDRRWLVLLPVPSEDDVQLTPGTTLQLYQENDLTKDYALTAHVTDPILGMPMTMVSCYVDKPWNREEGKYKDLRFNMAAVPIKDLGDPKIAIDKILAHPEIEVMVQRTASENVYSNMIVLLSEAYNKPHNFPHDRRVRALRDLLLANRPARVPTFDCYEGIADASVDFDGLNESQKLAIDQLKQAPAGVALVQGPPGTGKTFTIIRALQPFLKQDGQRALVLSSNNNSVSDLAMKLQQSVSGGVPGKYIVRLHALETEMSISKRMITAVERQQSGKEAISQDLDDVTTELLERLQLASTIYLHHQRHYEVGFEGVFDKSVQDLETAVGSRMLQIAGIIESADGPKPKLEKYEGFRELYQTFLQPGYHTAEEEQDFKKDLMKLLEDTLEGAAAIVTTPALATSASMRRVGFDALVFDEAARYKEVEVVSLMLYHVARMNLIVGDFKQLPPVVKTNYRNNLFAGQMSISLLSRLVGVGVPYVMLNTNYRMLPEISKAASTVCYHGKILDGVHIDKRPLAQKLRAFNRGRFGRPSNVLYFDVKPDATKLTLNSSRYNETFVRLGINLAKELMDKFPDATIAWLGFYQAHVRLAKTALDNLSRVDRKYRRLYINTVDAVQGMEWDFGIVDILIYGKSAGFMNNQNRLNVAFTRFRNGLYIHAHHSAVAHAEARHLQSFIQAFFDRKLRITDEPSDEYYQSGQLIVSS